MTRPTRTQVQLARQVLRLSRAHRFAENGGRPTRDEMLQAIRRQLTAINTAIERADDDALAALSESLAEAADALPGTAAAPQASSPGRERDQAATFGERRATTLSPERRRQLLSTTVLGRQVLAAEHITPEVMPR